MAKRKLDESSVCDVKACVIQRLSWPILSLSIFLLSVQQSPMHGGL